MRTPPLLAEPCGGRPARTVDNEGFSRFYLCRKAAIRWMASIRFSIEFA